MKVNLNGKLIETEENTLVHVLREYASITDESRGVAVAVDGSVIPRSRWGQTELDEGAMVELVLAVQGG